MKQMPNFGQTLTLINDSHNEDGDGGLAFSTNFDPLVASIKSPLPYRQIAVTAQNPQINPVIAIRQERQGYRIAQIAAHAAWNNFVLMNVATAYLKDPRRLGALIDNTDGVHPIEPAGNEVWADVFKTQFNRKA